MYEVWYVSKFISRFSHVSFKCYFYLAPHMVSDVPFLALIDVTKKWCPHNLEASPEIQPIQF